MKKLTRCGLRLAYGLAWIGLAACVHSPTRVVATPTVSARPTPAKPPEVAPAVAADVAVPVKDRDRQPAVADAYLAAQVRGNTAFALSLAAHAPEGNLIFSPYSISSALAMAYAGARGQTAAQMADALHFVLPPELLHPAFNALDLAFAARAGQGGEGFKLNVANALWGAKDLKLEPAFLGTVGSNYGGGLHLLDFSRPSAATAAINQWVAERTENRIQDLITLDAITPDTRLVLTNAVYFLAKWELPFAPRATDDRRFTLLDGKQVKVRMMHQENHFAYAEDDGWQAIQLPYQGGQVACDVVLPAAGGFAAFEQGLTAEKLDSLLGKLHGDQVMLSLPRFKATTTLSLAKALKALGMKDAFVYPAADFNGISAGGQLYISAVLHKAFVEVDESKTEAAAATAVVAIPGAAAPARPPKIIEMIVDHPFLFLIRDLPTGQILFWGRVVNPAG